MWPCPKCGREIGRDIAICPWCHAYVRGRTLFPTSKAEAGIAPPPDVVADELRQLRNRKRVLVVGVILVAMAVLLGGYYLALATTTRGVPPPMDAAPADSGPP